MTEKTRILPAGTWVVGTCGGSRVESIRTEQGPRDRFLLGIEVAVPDAWGGHKSEMIEVRLSEQMARDGAATRAQALTGRHVAVSVWVQTWTGKRGAGYSLQMSNGSAILELD